MSSATSLRGQEFETNFREGFVFKNAKHMLNDGFIDSGEILYDSFKNALGDVDGHYISKTDKLLIDLLPDKVGIFNSSFLIPSGSNVYFELTTTEGENLQRDDNGYILKKVQFHKKLLEGRAFNYN